MAPFAEKISKIGDKKTVKLLANHLYGKLGVKDYERLYGVLNGRDFADGTENFNIKKYREFYDYFICELNDVKFRGRVNNAALSATITSKARIKLYGLIKKLEVLGKGNVLLVNTDEVMVEALPSYIYGDDSVKVRGITLDEYHNKKKSFSNKRKNVGLDTAPYTLKDGMLF